MVAVYSRLQLHNHASYCMKFAVKFMYYYYDNLKKNKAKDKIWICASKKDSHINVQMQSLMLARSAQVRYLYCTVFYCHWSAYNHRIGGVDVLYLLKAVNTSVLMSNKENTLSHFMWLMISDDNSDCPHTIKVFVPV